MLEDRFGPVPEAVVDLMETVRLRWKAEKLGIEKLVLKNKQMKCYLLPASRDDFYSSPVFQQIMQFAQLNSRYFKIKEHKNRLILTVSDVSDISMAQKWLKEMLAS